MQNCMKKYQNEFSIKFAQIMGQNLNVWKIIQKKERKSLYSLSSFIWYFIAFLFGFIPGKREHNYNLELHCWLAVIFFICAVIINIQTTNKTYQNTIKSSLFPELLKVFGDKIFYNKSAGIIANSLSDSIVNLDDVVDIVSEMENFGSTPLIPNSYFESCQLYPREITQREDDDCFSGEYNGVKFEMDEADFGWNANDKHHTYNRMFKGLAMKFKMNKEIYPRVLVLSKFSFTKIPPNFERVTLEYEKFNKKYDVWVEKLSNGVSEQIEARYLLNTAFMDRFMQIQTSFKVRKMCCSVYGDNLLIMLSTRKDLFEMNHLLGKIDDIRQYKHLFDEFASVLSFIDVLNLSSKSKL